MPLPNSQNPQDSVFKASENEKKDTEMSHNITRNELIYMTKIIKTVMKFNKKFCENQESRKGKRLKKSSKEND